MICFGGNIRPLPRMQQVTRHPSLSKTVVSPNNYRFDLAANKMPKKTFKINMCIQAYMTCLAYNLPIDCFLIDSVYRCERLFFSQAQARFHYQVKRKQLLYRRKSTYLQLVRFYLVPKKAVIIVHAGGYTAAGVGRAFSCVCDFVSRLSVL